MEVVKRSRMDAPHPPPTASNNVSSRQPHPCTLVPMTTVLVVLAAIVIATPIVLASVIRDGARRNQAQERQDGDR